MWITPEDLRLTPVLDCFSALFTQLDSKIIIYLRKIRSHLTPINQWVFFVPTPDICSSTYILLSPLKPSNSERKPKVVNNFSCSLINTYILAFYRHLSNSDARIWLQWEHNQILQFHDLRLNSFSWNEQWRIISACSECTFANHLRCIMLWCWIITQNFKIQANVRGYKHNMVT